MTKGSRLVTATLTGVLLLSVLVLTGCAQVMAAKQPKRLDRSILTIGADRSVVIGVLGGAIGSETSEDGSKLLETYKYADGGGEKPSCVENYSDCLLHRRRPSHALAQSNNLDTTGVLGVRRNRIFMRSPL